MKPVDVIEFEKRRKLVEAHLPAVESLKPDPDFYHRTLVVLSYQFFDLGAVPEGLALLKGCPVDYFQNVLPRQMDQDPLFAELAERIANTLVDANMGLPEYRSPTRFFNPLGYA